MTIHRLALAAALAGTVLPLLVHAQAYPARPVTVIAPYGPGGPNDKDSRIITMKMSELHGQSFVVDYRPGAGTMLGTALAAKAPADGYTLFVVTASFTVLPAFYKDMPFDTIKDFAPISQLNRRINLLVAAPTFPVNDFREYLAHVKANPGKVNFATAGAGGVGHLAAEWMHSMAASKVTFVHYKQVANLIPDMAAGRIDATLTGLQFALPLVKAGKLKVLAVTDEERSRLLPQVRTAAEQGLPGYTYITWQGYAAPAGTPTAIINRLADGFSRVAKTPEIAAIFEAEGGAPVGSTPAQFRQLIITETERWKKVVQENGIKPDA